MKYYRDVRDAYHVIFGCGLTCITYGLCTVGQIPKIANISFIVGAICILISLLCIITITHPPKN